LGGLAGGRHQFWAGRGGTFRVPTAKKKILGPTVGTSGANFLGGILALMVELKQCPLCTIVKKFPPPPRGWVLAFGKAGPNPPRENSNSSAGFNPRGDPPQPIFGKLPATNFPKQQIQQHGPGLSRKGRGGWGGNVKLFIGGGSPPPTGGGHNRTRARDGKGPGL